MDYKRPGVFVEEISTLPPSVAAVATAIPAFIGYTEKAVDEDGKPLEDVVIRRISTMLEYQDYFGGPLPAKFELKVDPSSNAGYQFKRKSWGDGEASLLHSHLLYYALRLYFDNGGGSCYIVSVDRYLDGQNLKDVAPDKIKAGIEAIAKEDEPTLIVLADGLQLGVEDYGVRCQEVLAQCNTLKDRFGIFDLPEDDSEAAKFRMDIGNNYLSYGSVYTPYLQTSLAYAYREKDVNVSAMLKQKESPGDGLKFSYIGFTDQEPRVEIKAKVDKEELQFEVIGTTLTINGLPVEPGQEMSSNDLVGEWNTWRGDKGSFVLSVLDKDKTVQAGNHNLKSPSDLTLSAIKEGYTQHYNAFKKLLAKKRIVLPPSPAMAGAYASVDRDRGVWKAPANVSLASVIAPIRKITDEEQDRLNVDPTSGKSINAIRSFAGKGTMVWGSRTLAGNDNEWRYVPVRRLFIFIEESLQKATSFAVFEPNNTPTWLKVKAMAESFLYNLWQRGALAGSTPELAYFVNVGLGKTMTPQDILEGRLIIEIGIAAVRPAEFIILRFMHKLQEA